MSGRGSEAGAAGLEPWGGWGDRRQVHLTGYMGSGKTTVGLRLARQLLWSFLDLDVLVERHAGRRIADLVTEDGEAAFRDVESFVLRQAVQKPLTVLALGGGTLQRQGNLDASRGAAILVWLRCDAAELRRRLGGVHAHRPLWNPDELERHLSERLDRYSAADLIVDAEGDADAVAATIVRALRRLPMDSCRDQ